MRGDASDGLPGVAGVGEKTAASLLLKFGDLRGIVAAAGDPESDMSPGPRRRILDAAEYLLVAPKVVAVARDIDLPAYDATLPSEPRDPGRLDELAERYNLDSPVKRLRAVLAG
jgi:5'-3' exonuclease